ncbi:MAG: 30S ribosomal protein S6 [bacterium]
MARYQATFALKTGLNEEEKASLLDGFKDVVSHDKGEVEKISQIGVRKFAYEVKKEKEGFFMAVNFQINSSEVNRIREFLKTKEGVVRLMVLRRKTPPERKKEEGEKNGQSEPRNLNREPHSRS